MPPTTAIAAIPPRERSATGRLMIGSLVVAFLIATARWGSYLGAGGFYLTDLLLALAVTHWLATRLVVGSVIPSGGLNRWLLVLLLWSVLRLLFSPWPFTLMTLRDFAPFAYAIAGVLSADAWFRSGQEGRDRTGRLLLVGLRVHAAWYVTVLLVPELPGRLPQVQGLALLTPRPDVDSALLGVYAAWLLARAIAGVRPLLHLVGFAGAWAAILLLSQSRAGLLAAAAVTLLAVWASTRGQSAASRRTVAVGLAPLVLVALAPLAQTTDVGQRLLGTFGVESSDSAAARSGAGTAGARQSSWPLVYDYTTADSGRLTSGVGFGPDFMRESRADVRLLGDNAVTATRSPHNVWLGTWARLGLIGTLALAGAIISALLAIRRCGRRIADDPLLMTTAGVVVGFAIAATVGVVIESPFGAIPLWWSVGVVCAVARAQGDRNDPSVPPHGAVGPDRLTESRVVVHGGRLGRRHSGT